MKKSLLLVLSLGWVLFFTGCAPKVKIQSLHSSQVASPSSKQLAIFPFKNDKVSQSSSIAAVFSQHTIYNKPYFQLVERENLQKLLAEKRLNDSALVDIEDFSSIKGLTQAKSFLFGEVQNSSLKKHVYTQVVNNYNRCVQYNKENTCIRYAKIFRQCQTNTYSLLTYIKLVEVESAHVLFSKNYQEDKTIEACGNSRVQLPSKTETNTLLAQKIALHVLKDIAPTYIALTIPLLDDLDVDLNDKEEQDFENALTLLQNKRFEISQELLHSLNQKTAYNSYVILYNLGITYEAMNQLEKALELYKKAEYLSLKEEVLEEISQAILRVTHNLNEIKRTEALIK